MINKLTGKYCSRELLAIEPSQLPKHLLPTRNSLQDNCPAAQFDWPPKKKQIFNFL